MSDPDDLDIPRLVSRLITIASVPGAVRILVYAVASFHAKCGVRATTEALREFERQVRIYASRSEQGTGETRTVH